MSHAKARIARAEELRAMLTAYRQLTIEEAERGNWGDIQVELEGELWRIEQDLLDRVSRRRMRVHLHGSTPRRPRRLKPPWGLGTERRAAVMAP
jgi:hypothetical protein